MLTPYRLAYALYPLKVVTMVTFDQEFIRNSRVESFYITSRVSDEPGKAPNMAKSGNDLNLLQI